MGFFVRYSISPLIVLLVNAFIVQGLICPPDEEIAPCHCVQELGNVRCHEWFGNVNQDLLNKVANTLRQVNNVAPDQWLDVNIFHVGATPMTTMDLAPFLGIRFQLLSLSFSSNMNEFYIPQVGGGQLGIEATKLQIISNNFDDQALASLFTSQIVAPNSLKSLLIGGNRIGGAENEFIPGLAQYTQLEEIDLRENEQVVTLANGPFRSNGALRHVDLASAALSQIGQDAFAIDSNGNIQNELLSIDLAENGLSDMSFDSANGLWYPNTRPSLIDLSRNQFEFLSENNFKQYLNLNNANQLELKENSLICDQRMKWMKDDANNLQNRVHNAWCTNDPGQTVFTTNLIN